MNWKNIWVAPAALIVCTELHAQQLCHQLFQSSFTDGRSWNTWVSKTPDAQGYYHSFSQWVPESVYSNTGKNLSDYISIYHRTSKNNKTWEDKGPLKIIGLPKSKSKGLIGSGHVVVNNGESFLFYSYQSNKKDKKPSIVIAKSVDGIHFEYLGEALNTNTILKHPFYQMKNRNINGHPILSEIKDPFVYRGSDGKWNMIFSATSFNPEGYPTSAIGFATSSNLKKWNVENPLIISQDPRSEFELPQIINNNGTTILKVAEKFEGESRIRLWAQRPQDLYFRELEVDMNTISQAQYGFKLHNTESGSIEVSFYNPILMSTTTRRVPLKLDLENLTASVDF